MEAGLTQSSALQTQHNVNNQSSEVKGNEGSTFAHLPTRTCPEPENETDRINVTDPTSDYHCTDERGSFFQTLFR